MRALDIAGYAFGFLTILDVAYCLVFFIMGTESEFFGRLTRICAIIFPALLVTFIFLQYLGEKL